MILGDPSQNLFSFTQTSSFSFHHKGLVETLIRPIDQKIKQINIIVTIKTQQSTSVYQQTLQYSDFFKPNKSYNQKNLILSNLENYDNIGNTQNGKKNQININKSPENNSLLWIKLYLQDYLKKIQYKISLNKSQRQVQNILNSLFILTDQVYMRKVYKNPKQIQQKQTYLQINQNNLKAKTLFLRINPSILTYPNDIFEQPFLINLPKKLNQDQQIVSIVQINQKKKQQAEKQIQNIFFDNKLK